MNKKILVLGTYPIINAQHGGQKRVEAIVEEYRQAGFSVKYVGIFDSRFYPEHSADDIPVISHHQLSPIQVYTSDMTAGYAISQDETTRTKLVAQIEAYKPHVIQLEQGFLYLGLKQLIQDINWSGKLVYSSHNVEYKLKQAILNDVPQVGREDAETAVKRLESMEKDLAKSADLVIACTVSDGSVYKKWGARNIVVAPNGIKKQKADPDVVERWRKRYKKQGIDKLILFVGSAHPPNEHGFMELIGSRIGFLPPNARIVLVGGVSDLIKQRLEGNYAQYCMPLRVDFLGRVAGRDLAALLSLADVIILPITEGGGSNLKTAEAILSNKKVVATSVALRSYEAYEKLPTIYVGIDGEGFRAAISKALEGKVNLSQEQIKLTQTVQWEYTLKTMVEGMKQL